MTRKRLMDRTIFSAVLRRVALAALLGALVSCRSAEVDAEIRVVVLPRVLEDDGSRARVIISTNDEFGDPGVGSVHVVSSAGSLRDGPDCHDTVTVKATWLSTKGVSVLQTTVNVTVHNSDAFVSACAF